MAARPVLQGAYLRLVDRYHLWFTVSRRRYHTLMTVSVHFVTANSDSGFTELLLQSTVGTAERYRTLQYWLLLKKHKTAES